MEYRIKKEDCQGFLAICRSAAPACFFDVAAIDALLYPISAMPRVLILSSHVAASPVGGGAQVVALARRGIDTVLVPTVLFGRHPGLGHPGGGPVAIETFEDMLRGVQTSGALEGLDAVITGYFASADQVAAAARTIDAVRAANPKARIVVDPIMGDHPRGLYVREDVAMMIAADLVPRAGLVAPNAWELERLVGPPAGDSLEAARALGRPVLVSSIDRDGDIAVLYADAQEAWLASHRRIDSAPNGTGDRLTALFTAGLVLGASPSEALRDAVTAVAEPLIGSSEIRLDALA
jgi:pyridoxine kinase